MPYTIIDRMDERPAVNELRCSCGAELHPDCDMSDASILQAMDEHCREEHDAVRQF